MLQMLKMLQLLQLQLGDSCNCNGMRTLQAIGCEDAAAGLPDGQKPVPTLPYSQGSTKWDGKGDILENHLVSHECLHNRSLKVGEN
jgi:hypothetical protein